jgi:SAM-dependent methyltransferase
VAAARPRVLDVGCGTGRHASLLAEKGHDVSAIDLSPDMIRVAKAKPGDVKYACCSIADFDQSGFNFAYSLFNVVNCLTSLAGLVAFFDSIAERLADGAMLLVESWNPIAVIATPPTVVERIYEHGDERIVRRVSPMPDFFRQRLDLEYAIDVYRQDSPTRVIRSFRVVHHLVLFTPLEIAYCLERAGFGDITTYTALPEMAPATADDRMLAFTARKGVGRTASGGNLL